MNKRTIERGYKYAQKYHEETGKLPDMDQDKYELCGADFRQGVDMFEKDLKNNVGGSAKKG